MFAKLDVDLIADVAGARPDYAFALVGPTGMGETAGTLAAGRFYVAREGSGVRPEPRR